MPCKRGPAPLVVRIIIWITMLGWSSIYLLILYLGITESGVLETIVCGILWGGVTVVILSICASQLEQDI